MIVEIGIAPVIPAEFVVFRIGRTEDVLEVTES
jgi:phage tail sheath protein FI